MKLPVIYDNLEWQEKRTVREEYVKVQNGRCYWCDSPLDKDPPKRVKNKRVNRKLFPPNFFKHPVHLQHCHKSGLTEGAVHNYCNAVMWQYHGR